MTGKKVSSDQAKEDAARLATILATMCVIPWFMSSRPWILSSKSAKVPSGLPDMA